MSTVVGTPPGVTASHVTIKPFSPPDLSGLQSWWDASDPATITASAGAVSQWNDKAPGGRHLVQATAAAKPTTGTATRNGRNVLVFDGADGLTYTGTTGINVGTFTAFVTAAETVAVNSAGLIVLYTGANDYNDNNAAFVSTEDTASSSAADLYSNGTRAIAYQGPTGALLWATIAVAGVSGTPQVYWNGVAGTSSSPGTGNGVAAGGFVVGSRWLSGALYSPAGLNGQIGEIILYNRILTDTERRKVESYLKTKWGTP